MVPLLNQILIFTLFFLRFSPAVHAREFWLEPEKFICERGQTINVHFLEGADFKGVNWNGNASGIHSLKIYWEDVTDDLSGDLSEKKGDSLQLAMFDEGTAMIVFNSNNSFVDRDTQKFNDYAEKQGQENAENQPEQHNEHGIHGKELYQRNLKTLVQVGDKMTNTFAKPTSLPLDISLLSNPYTLKTGELVTIKVRFNKIPLINSPVKLWQRLENKTVIRNLMTDTNGQCRFVVQTIGKWMVTTEKKMCLKNNPDAAWQSYQGSLTWGY